MRGGTDEDVDLTGGMESDDRALPQAALEPDGPRHLGGPEAADLHIRRQTDAEVAPVLSAFCLLVA